MNNKLLQFLVVMVVTFSLLACSSKEDEKVKAAVSSAQEAQALLEEAKKLKDTMDTIDNRKDNIESKLKAIDEKDFGTIRDNVVITNEKLIALEKDPRYKEILERITNSQKEMQTTKDKQEGDIAYLDGLKKELEPRVKDSVNVSTVGKDNYTDNPDERITIKVRDNLGNVMMTEVYTGTGILTEAIHKAKDQSGNYYDAHKITYDATTGVKTSYTERNSKGQLTSVQTYDNKTGNLIKHELYVNGVLSGTVLYTYQLDEDFYDALSINGAGEGATNKECESGVNCVSKGKNKMKVSNVGQILEPKAGFFTKAIYTPTGLDVSANKCYIKGKGRVTEQLIYFNETRRAMGLDPVEYFTSSFNEDCSKLHCQVKHIKLHNPTEIDPETCCDSDNPDGCTSAIAE